MTLDQRIENWARWVRASPFGVRLSQCDSLEGNWRSPQRNHWPDEAPPPSRLAAPDPHDAWDVTLATATLPTKYHMVLKLRHVVMVAGRRLDDRSIARELRRKLRQSFKPSDVPAAESMAKVMLSAALMIPIKQRRESTVDKARHLIAIAS